MKIEFLDNYNIWDLKDLNEIKRKIFNQLEDCDEIILDVRGCAFDYLSAPELVRMAIGHLIKSEYHEAGKEFKIIFEDMTSTEVSSEFFGAIVTETDDVENLVELIDAWAKENHVHITLLQGEDNGELEMMAEYGKIA